MAGPPSRPKRAHGAHLLCVEHAPDERHPIIRGKPARACSRQAAGLRRGAAGRRRARSATPGGSAVRRSRGSRASANGVRRCGASWRLRTRPAPCARAWRINCTRSCTPPSSSMDHLEGAGIGVADAPLLRRERMFEDVDLDPVIGERLQVPGDHLHDGDELVKRLVLASSTIPAIPVQPRTALDRSTFLGAGLWSSCSPNGAWAARRPSDHEPNGFRSRVCLRLPLARAPMETGLAPVVSCAQLLNRHASLAGPTPTALDRLRRYCGQTSRSLGGGSRRQPAVLLTYCPPCPPQPRSGCFSSPDRFRR